ncbi:MAG: hypothetical protein K5859_01755 [Atopobiaceae bacterium]|nr:hypothetical protein [Atopobiaceae bacterium]
MADDLDGLDIFEMEERLSSIILAETRITLIAADGEILYDTHADKNAMGNHNGREEVIEAREQGQSVVLRRSETMGTDTLYAADEVCGGIVLRLAETRTSLPYYLRSLLAPLALAALLAVALSAVLSRAITRSVVTPLLQVDMDEPLESSTYAEIEPLLSRIDALRTGLIAQNDQLERAVSIRREFTGNVSHEMKSPLQVIGGYAELIESGVVGPEETQRFAGLIREESESMRVLIDDVLFLSTLDEGALSDSYLIDLSEVCRDVCDKLEPVANAQGAEVMVSCPEGMTVWGATPVAERIVRNLLENALRYGGGRVEVRTERKDGTVVLSVSDNGTGVPVELRERIFERFYRIEPSRSRETGGTGLGLAIVRNAAHSLGGTSSVEDSELGGARFVVTLPAAREAERNHPNLPET